LASAIVMNGTDMVRCFTYRPSKY